jgi:hypothetical protein
MLPDLSRSAIHPFVNVRSVAGGERQKTDQGQQRSSLRFSGDSLFAPAAVEELLLVELSLLLVSTALT